MQDAPDLSQPFAVCLPSTRISLVPETCTGLRFRPPDPCIWAATLITAQHTCGDRKTQLVSMGIAYFERHSEPKGCRYQYSPYRVKVPRGSHVVPVLVVYQSLKQKTSHNQKGATLESLGKDIGTP